MNCIREMKIDDTSQALFNPPLYIKNQRQTTSIFERKIKTSGPLTPDVAAVMGILSFNYATGDRTLFEEVTRQPWLSSFTREGDIKYEAIPPHEYYWESSSHISEKLYQLLLEEADNACRGREEIYVLLSGGLDSRIVAGIAGELYRKGKISRPIAVTWGLEDSRDVQYAKKVAQILDFEWHHITIEPETIMDNVYEGFPQIGGMVSPLHLHAMRWFKNVSADAIVLAGSYGDSIGRAEFSGMHLLELGKLKMSNPFGLLRAEVLRDASNGIMNDVRELEKRAPIHSPDYVKYEYEAQGFYMRNMLGQVMDVINQYCSLYQMFTAPKVYSYMWSLHPSRRDNSIYEELLETRFSELSRIPWARTNKALRGKTLGADLSLQKEFHNYMDWCSGELYPEINSLVEPERLAATGIFDPEAVRRLNTSLAPNNPKLNYLGMQPYNVWLWLAGISVYWQNLELKKWGPRIKDDQPIHGIASLPQDTYSKLRRKLSSNKMLHKNVSKARRFLLNRNAIKTYPPVRQ